jgi:hypothetical protein
LALIASRVEKRRPQGAPAPDSNSPTVRSREEMPTLPFDLSEYARDATGEPRTEALPGSDELDFDLERVPKLTASREELLKANLDHKAGFLVSLLDGVSTVEMIVDVAGMSRDEALATLQSLYLRRLIRFV